MRDSILALRDRLDRVGVLVSGLCVVHCVAGIALVGMLGVGGGVLLNPEIHRVGLALAVVIGAATIGLNAIRHGRLALLALGAAGLSLMTAALFVGHGTHEALLTIAGVAMVATAHVINIRRGCCN
ncbi:MAG: MerC domain-containing protein [Sphingomonadales bacterium]|nr:MerC domain-containing protein [Sphingomonadales bacterium]MDE2569932.1 MerC domain-containing protein [Sphingomonadales bacterium]